MKKAYSVITALLMLTALNNCYAQMNGKIKVYFNHPVNTTLSNGVNAVCLHNLMMDTIAAYISRAKYTVDIAQYDYSAYSGDTMAHIATAINNAYARGVKVRWIYDGSSSNSGLSLLSAGIQKLASPTSGSTAPCGGTYNISHNKFVVIDVWDSTRAVISDGSEDWSQEMDDDDYNNIVFIQSKVLARAFTNEFNIMWGDTTHGAASNSTNSKFGPCKPNSGTHTFTIGGSQVDLYFSPSDGTNTQVISVINSANVDMYSAMYDFTQTQYSTPFTTKVSAGVYTSCILDEYSSGSGSAYTAMSGSPNFVEYLGGCCTYIYHNKYMIVDPSNACSDPVVLTGSMNWTAAGYDQNDENIIIIHNDTVANEYLQSYAQDYKVISGKSLTKQTGCVTGIDNTQNNENASVVVYPNPSNGSATINYSSVSDGRVTIKVYNMIGQVVCTLANNENIDAGEHQFKFVAPSAGIYLLNVTDDKGNMKVIKMVAVN